MSNAYYVLSHILDGDSTDTTELTPLSSNTWKSVLGCSVPFPFADFSLYPFSVKAATRAITNGSSESF